MKTSSKVAVAMIFVLGAITLMFGIIFDLKTVTYTFFIGIIFGIAAAVIIGSAQRRRA